MLTLIFWFLSTWAFANDNCPLKDEVKSLHSATLVDLETIENRIEELRRSTANPEAGLFGPQSMMWTLNRESILQLAGGRAVLMQLAHPAIAHSISSVGEVVKAPTKRMQKTLRALRILRYSPLDEVFEMAKTLYHIHSRISGDSQASGPYHALDAKTQLWVLSTILDSWRHVFEEMIRPLTITERETYHSEIVKTIKLFGIPEDLIPESFVAFDKYVTEYSNQLTVSPDAKRLAALLFQSKTLALFAKEASGNSAAGVLARHYPNLAYHSLPTNLRSQFTPFNKNGGAFLWACVKIAYRSLPRSVKDSREYKKAMQRLKSCDPTQND